MKTATVRDLRNRYTVLLEWVAAGEEILITRRGNAIARLVPETSSGANDIVNWSESPAVTRNRDGEPVLSRDDAAATLKDSSGSW
jgi:prevent-host-death family protein